MYMNESCANNKIMILLFVNKSFYYGNVHQLFKINTNIKTFS